MRLPLLLASALLATGCAQTAPGWTGSRSVPFDAAERQCAQATATIADRYARDEAYRDCMRDKGWTPAR